MARTQVPYPPSPGIIPADLTVPSARYRARVVLVLLSLLLFLVLYVSLIAGSASLVYWALTVDLGNPRDPRGPIAVRFLVGIIGGLICLYLIKGLFKRQQPDKSLRVEVTEDDQPVLFGFIRRLCDELGAPFPHRVFVTPEVNAAVFYESSVLSLVWPTPKNLLVGLGLVNVLNLSEFKAVLAHEFGHFSQKEMKLGSYVYVCNRIIADVVGARDWLDDLLMRAKQIDVRVTVFVLAFEGVLWLLRQFLMLVFKAINIFHASLSRQMEFHADLVAVSVTGSDAIVHGLARLNFANDALGQAFRDLNTAADHKLYTADLLYHQNHAASYLRAVKKDPDLGEPPPAPAGGAGKVYVFKPGDEGIPPMWASHPPNFDREANAKDIYLPTQFDERSPWVLFTDPAELRHKVTRRYYRVAYKVPRDAALSDPGRVQEFIDQEHAETTYPERYHGLYDGRLLRIEDVQSLAAKVRQVKLPDAAVTADKTSLYGDGLKDWVEQHNKRQEEYQLLNGLQQGVLTLSKKTFEFRGKDYTAASIKKLFKKVTAELDEDSARLVELDAKVFQTCYRMARRVSPRRDEELLDRYVFHMTAQEMLATLSGGFGALDTTFMKVRGRQLTPAEGAELFAMLREVHGAFAHWLDKAGGLKVPAMKNLTAGEPLKRLILDEPLIPGLSADQEGVSGEWVNRFMTQLAGARERAKRIHFKSLGGILAVQEEVERAWDAGQLLPLPKPDEADDQDPAYDLLPGDEHIPDALPADEE